MVTTSADLRTSLAEMVLELEEQAADCRVNEERYAGETGEYMARGKARVYEEVADRLAALIEAEAGTA